MKVMLVMLCGWMATSCSVVHPDGAVDDLIEGDLFTGSRVREVSRPQVDALPAPTRGPVRWRIDF